jgi:restriction system protein
MPFPQQKDIEIPLLKALVQLGGEAKPRDIYPLVATFFPELTPEEQEERLENYPSVRKWSNLVQWVRQRLVDQENIDGSTRGVWRITPAGRARVKDKSRTRSRERQATGTPTPSTLVDVNLRDLLNLNLNEVKARILAELKNLTPTAFEHFCREFLEHLGYRNVAVTRQTQDGGIDGHGDFRQGAISIKSAYQAKRWTDTAVGRPEIDRFRGAIQGEYDHGVYITTSRFTRDATEASYKKGAITILLLDGPAIADIMVDKGAGIRKQPLYLYDVEEDFFTSTSET